MKYNKSVFTTLSLVSQLGFSIIAPILLCVFLGVKLEEKIDFPFTVIFIVLGVLAGVRNAYELVRRTYEDSKEKNHEES